MEEPSKPTAVKCLACGYANSPELRFCGNCGNRLHVAVGTPASGTLAVLEIATGIYLLVSILFNGLVQASPIFWIPYLLSALLGLYAGNEFRRRRVSARFKVASALAIAIGLASTLILFVVGLGAQGVIGPVWIFFVLSAWLLLRVRKSS